MEEQITYAAAGVDIEEGARAVDAIKGAVHSTYRPEVVGDIGGFGGLFSLAAAKDMADPLLVSGTDGVGTKLKVAQMLGKHDTVGIDLVAMCANDILATGAEPLFFLDYVAVGKLDSQAMAEIVGGIAEGCRQAGCALIGGEMAEHPGVMDPDDYDLSGFCVGLVDRPKMLDPESVAAGDVLIALPSTGLHSNGYSLARKVCVEGKAPEELTVPVEALAGQSVLEALLTPTRIYVKPEPRTERAGRCRGGSDCMAGARCGALRVREGVAHGSGGAQDLQHGPGLRTHRGAGEGGCCEGGAGGGRRDLLRGGRHRPRHRHRAL